MKGRSRHIIKGPSHGLHINMERYEVFWSSGDNSFTGFPEEVKQINQVMGGAEFLGSPVFGCDSLFAK